jgi:hypothetical protein
LLFVFTVPLSIAVSEGLFVLGLLGWGVKIAFERKLHWRRTPLDFPILSFVTIAFLSSFWGVDIRNSLIGFRTYALILIIYLLFNSVSESGKGKILVWSLISGASILSVFTAIDRLSMVTSGLDPVLAGSMSEAGQLLIVIGITVAFLLYQKGRRARILLLFPILIMVLAEVLNFKRGSWVALIVVLIIQGCVKSRKIIPVVVVLSIAISFLYQPVRERLLDLRDEFSPLRGGRVAMWETLPAIMRDHPMGVGIDNVGSVMYRYNPEIEKGRDHLHSTCPQIFAEMGPLGLAAFVWWMVVFIRVSHSTFRRIGDENPYEKALALGIFSAFIGFLINGIVEFNFGDSEVVMIIYFLMGLTLLQKCGMENVECGTN